MRQSRQKRSVAATIVEGIISKGFDILLRIKPAKGILGIEITDRCIKLVEIVRHRHDSYKLKKYIIEKLPENVVDDGRILDSSHVIFTLQIMLAKINLKVKKVHLILPSQLIMVRFLKLPNIPMKNLRKLIDFEMMHNIHLPFDLPFYDFVVVNREEQMLQMPSQCEIMLVAAPQDLIHEYQGIFTSASLKPVSMEFKALSLFRVLELSDRVNPHSTMLLIDINEHVSDVSIFHNRQLKITRNIPMNFASQGTDADFINACLDLGFEIERLMNFYRYTLNNREHEFSDILVSGDVSRLNDLVDRLAERVPCKISILSTNHIQSNLPDFSALFPSLAVPIGLALRGR
jgi:type IV pilus assembly protein PilM